MTTDSKNQLVDHLFRHQYGKMVAILSKFIGLQNLDIIEDAVQDTFLKATAMWRNQMPENPEAWLTQVAKNRAIDILRKNTVENSRNSTHDLHSLVQDSQEVFLDHEVEDSQLRMLFVACDPRFSLEEQIVFALKSLSGFSLKEIAAALMQKEETIKKRLARSRKKIKSAQIELSYPEPKEIESRFAGVLQIIYLIFNEGFHSTKPEQLINKEICGEAIRLCKLLMLKERFRSGSLYALFALMCYHAARLDTKVLNGEIVDLKNQDRSQWYLPLIVLANDALTKSWAFEDRSIYHLEAAIVSEHVRAIQFENTNWTRILSLYEEMYQHMPTDSILLSKATIYIQIKDATKAAETLNRIDSTKLQQREYLYHGCWAEYYDLIGDSTQWNEKLQLAIHLCSNLHEKKYLERKLELGISREN